jgi:hypothetical protein
LYEVADNFPHIVAMAMATTDHTSPVDILKAVLSKISESFFGSGSESEFLRASRIARDADKVLKSGGQLPEPLTAVLSTASHVMSLLTLRPKYVLHALSEFCFSSKAPLTKVFRMSSSAWDRLSTLPKEFADDAVMLDALPHNADGWVSAWTAMLAAAIQIDKNTKSPTEYRCALKVTSRSPLCNLQSQASSRVCGFVLPWSTQQR